MREVVAKRIMEMAQRGVQDHKTLVEGRRAFCNRQLRRTQQTDKLVKRGFSVVVDIAERSFAVRLGRSLSHYLFVRRHGNRYKASGEFPQSVSRATKLRRKMFIHGRQQS